MFYCYILLFLLYYYISILSVYATPKTFCLDLYWVILFCSIFPLYIYKDSLLPLLSSLVNINILIFITCSVSYHHDPLLFEISDLYSTLIIPFSIYLWYTWNILSYKYNLYSISDCISSWRLASHKQRISIDCIWILNIFAILQP